VKLSTPKHPSRQQPRSWCSSWTIPKPPGVSHTALPILCPSCHRTYERINACTVRPGTTPKNQEHITKESDTKPVVLVATPVAAHAAERAPTHGTQRALDPTSSSASASAILHTASSSSAPSTSVSTRPVASLLSKQPDIKLPTPRGLKRDDFYRPKQAAPRPSQSQPL